MARKRKSEATGLDEVDRTMYSTFCTGANSLSQLYTQAMNQQKLSFQAGERHALEKLYQWILRQHEEGSRVTAADIVTHIQNEIDYGEDASMSPRLQSQYPHPQTAMHFTNPSASYGQATAGTTPRGAPSDQGGGCYPNGGQGGRNHDANSPAHNRANSPGSNDSSMDMHSDSPPHES